MKKSILIFASSLTIGLTTFAQDVNIPDANFKAYLIGKFDSDNNGQISDLEAASVENINLPVGTNITSLTGIESFKNLTLLTCIFVPLTSLDVSKNVKLTWLQIVAGKLTSLDVSKNVALTLLECHSNQLTNLDVSNNIALRTLNCSENQLSNLSVSKLSELEYLYCEKNLLKSLDTRQNLKLFRLECFENQLTSLDLRNNLDLLRLECNNNPNLASICVNSKNQVTSYWTKDALTSYNETCTTSLETEDKMPIKSVSKIYSIHGQEVNSAYQGLVIIQYSNGSTKRMIQ